VILSVASFVCWVIESYICTIDPAIITLLSCQRDNPSLLMSLVDKADEGYYALYSSEVIFAVFFTFDYTLHMFVSPSMYDIHILAIV